jgi:uncharacterized protein YndB with AHSA1/START domain
MDDKETGMKILGGLLVGAMMATAAASAGAAARSQATITIDAPIDRVWALVVDVDHWPDWNKAVGAAHLKGPVAKGSVFEWKSGGLAIRSTFQDVAPMRRLSWTGQTIGTRAVHAWAFVTTDKGVVVTTTETFDGWLPAILPGVMQKTLDDTLPALLTSLKAAAEKDRRGR